MFQNKRMAERQVQPEILDTLAPTDPAAIASRRDMRLLNRLMGNYRWFCNCIRQLQAPLSVVELGAGDGTLALCLQKGIRSDHISLYTGVDLIPEPAGWPTGWIWARQDLRFFPIDSGNYDVLLANLILHQFVAEELSVLGGRINRSGIRVLLINEPARRTMHLWQIAVSRILRVHAVTLHDAKVSICAGFRRKELTSLLGLHENDWNITHMETFMGANRLICERKE